jgi:type IV pilus assembly protein PilW
MNMSAKSLKQQMGFSIVEIMVGLVIGLIVTLVVVQVYATFEGQKRRTGGGADAQTNGTLALYGLQRDASAAGFGLPASNSAASAFNCPVGTLINGVAISPVSIVDGGGGAGNSDTIVFRSGTGAYNSGVATTKITGVNGTALTVDNSLGCNSGDVALIINADATVCGSSTIATLTGSTGLTLSAAPASAVVTGSVACMGAPASAWVENSYAVAGNNLMLTTGGAAAVNVASGIVNIQAQYGISTAGNVDTVSAWVDATDQSAAAGGVNWAAPTLANRNRIKAIRIAVVARNGQLEQAAVTAPCSAAYINGPCSWTGGPAVNLTNLLDAGGATNWQNYRYRVFSAIVPLRSMVWTGGN